jgi:hypothetical protein
MPIYRYGPSSDIFILSDNTWAKFIDNGASESDSPELLTRYFDRNVTISPRNNGIRCKHDHEQAEGW